MPAERKAPSKVKKKAAKKATPSKRKAAKRKRKLTPRAAAAELAIEKRREKVANLRLAAWSIRDIAAHLKCSVGTVHKDIEAVFDRHAENSEDAIRREREVADERLNVGLKAIWDEYSVGDHSAIDRVLRIEERRAKLKGLDAPTKQSVELQIEQLRGAVHDLIMRVKPKMSPGAYAELLQAIKSEFEEAEGAGVDLEVLAGEGAGAGPDSGDA